MLVIKCYAGIVMKIVLSMAGLEANNGTGVMAAKELLLKAILIMPAGIAQAHGYQTW